MFGHGRGRSDGGHDGHGRSNGGHDGHGQAGGHGSPAAGGAGAAGEVEGAAGVAGAAGAGGAVEGAGAGGRCDWLIVGLGNPGREYADTRHNVGFMVLDELARRWRLGRARERFRGRIAEGRVPTIGDGIDANAPPRVAVLWPQTYMNEAGRAAGPARGQLRVPLERVISVHDDIDIPFGDVRVRMGGGLAGHNGLKSLRRELGSAEFVRVRVGVGRPASSDPEIVSAYVLARFREPADEVSELVRRAADAVQRIVLGQQTVRAG